MKAKAGSLHDLIEAWRAFPGTDGRPQRDPSPEWLQLSPATRKSNEHMIDPKHGYLRRAVKLDLGTLMLSAIDTPNVVKIRNKVGKAFGFWTGNFRHGALDDVLVGRPLRPPDREHRKGRVRSGAP